MSFSYLEIQVRDRALAGLSAILFLKTIKLNQTILLK
jgi:hypothetical protein